MPRTEAEAKAKAKARPNAQKTPRDKNLIAFWWENARPVSLPQSLTPALLAICLSVYVEGFNIALGLVAVAGVVFAHLSMNLFDDYFDYRKMDPAYRAELVAAGGKARNSKCPYIMSGQATPGQLLIACLAFLAIALALAAVVFAFRGWPTAVFAAILLVLGISYSGGPLKLGYRGFGELVIGVIFGPLEITGVYFSATGGFSWAVLVIGIAAGLLVTNVVYVHSILDIQADKAGSKLTLAGLLKSPGAILAACAGFAFVPHLLMALLVAIGALSPLFLLCLLTLPWGIDLVFSVRRFLRDPDGKVSRKAWAGPMGDWEKYVAAGLDWFMYRWLMARNALMFFCVMCIVAALIPIG